MPAINDRIEQEFAQVEQDTLFTCRKDFDLSEVPADSYIIFPSVRHVPDLEGYGCQSDSLPAYLQIFGYWGYRLQIARGNILRIIPAVKKPASISHCAFWLYHNYDECLAAQKKWEKNI